MVTYLLMTTALAVTSYMGTREGAHALHAPIAGSGQLMSLGSAELALVLSFLQTSVVSFSAQLRVAVFPGRPGSEVPGTQTVEPAGIPNLLVPYTEVGRWFGAKSSHTSRGSLVILGAGSQGDTHEGREAGREGKGRRGQRLRRGCGDAEDGRGPKHVSSAN